MKLSIEEFNELLKYEIEFAEEINPVMALGMRRVQDIVNTLEEELQLKSS